MYTRSVDQMGCGSKPLSYLGAFRVLWWTFSGLFVEFPSYFRRTSVERPSNLCLTLVEMLSNFCWPFVDVPAELYAKLSKTTHTQPKAWWSKRRARLPWQGIWSMCFHLRHWLQDSPNMRGSRRKSSIPTPTLNMLTRVTLLLVSHVLCATHAR